jgi:hypothetical protein
MKDGLHEQNFPVNSIIVAAVRKWVSSAGTDFYDHSMQAFVHRWQKCVASGGDYVE